MKLLTSKPFLYMIFGLLVAITPLFIEISRSTMTMLNTVIIYGIVALGFNILLGYAGQISLGHAAFMGLGAYVSAYFVSVMELPFLFALLLSGIIPMLIGLLLGLVALRLEGHYLAIATLGFGVTLQQVFKEWIPFTNGFSGMKTEYPQILGFVFRTRESYFVLVIIIFIILALFAYNLLKSKTGRALIAMRDSEHAAQAMGVSLFRYKLIAFAISAFYAGIAGSLYIHLIRYTSPNDWGIELSLNLLAMVVIGGLASIGGAIWGASFIVMVPEIIKEIPLLEGINSISSILTGLALILVIMFFPYGLARIGTQTRLTLSKRTKNNAKRESGF